MKLKEKLADECALDAYWTDSIRDIQGQRREAYLAGFEKARELAVKSLETYRDKLGTERDQFMVNRCIGILHELGEDTP